MWKGEKEIHHKEWVHGIMEADKPADLQLASWGRRDPLLCFYFLVSRKPAGSRPKSQCFRSSANAEKGLVSCLEQSGRGSSLLTDRGSALFRL